MPKHRIKSVNPNSSIRKQLLSLSTGILSDALGKGGAMDHDMKCLSASCPMAGPAATLRVHTADILMVGKAVSLCPRGRVLVIDGQGELNTALWGGIITVWARRKGLQGVVIDGAVRDFAEIRRERFPVFARAVVPNAGGAEYPGQIGVSVQCGGLVVNPGDWVVGDEDGVVVIPANHLTAVLKKGKLLRLIEKRITKEIQRGKDLASILGYDELLELKTNQVAVPQLRFSGKNR